MYEYSKCIPVIIVWYETGLFTNIYYVFLFNISFHFNCFWLLHKVLTTFAGEQMYWTRYDNISTSEGATIVNPFTVDNDGNCIIECAGFVQNINCIQSFKIFL